MRGIKCILVIVALSINAVGAMSDQEKLARDFAIDDVYKLTKRNECKYKEYVATAAKTAQYHQHWKRHWVKTKPV